MLRVSAIVVTYNRVALLKKCIKHLLNQSYKLTNIFIVNNHSVDGTKQYLNRLSYNYDLIHSINMKKNVGGAGGFSIGVKKAYMLTNSDAFWLMDDDTIPTFDALKYLMLGAKNVKYKFGFLCSNVRWWKNNNPCNMPTVNDGLWTKYVLKRLLGVKESTFVSFLVPRFSVYKFGLPLAKAFIWGDDTEYSRRISEKVPSYYVSNSVVIHFSNNPDLSCYNIFSDVNSRISRYKYMYRNRLYIERKYGSFKTFFKWIIILNLILLKIPFQSKNKRLKRMFYTLDGILSGLFFNPRIEFLSKK